MDRVSVDPDAKQFILRRNEERRLKNLGNGQVTMRARKRRILQKWKTKSLVAESGLRLDAVDLGEESPDIFFKYTFCILSHNFTINVKSRRFGIIMTPFSRQNE